MTGKKEVTYGGVLLLLGIWVIVILIVNIVSGQVQIRTPLKKTVTCVRWVDITGDIGWVDETELVEPAKVTSCGIFVKETEDTLWLAMDKADDDSYNSTGAFPKGVILRREEIEVNFD